MLSNAKHLLAGYTLSTVIPRSKATWGSTSVNRQWKIATATPRNDELDRLFQPSIYIGKMDGPSPIAQEGICGVAP